MRQIEHMHAVALMNWWNVSANRFDVDYRLLAAIPNGGHRHIGTARKLKAEGVRPGIPDYFLFVPRARYHGLALELKAPENGRLSREQNEMMALLSIEGYKMDVAFGWEDARKIIESYLRLPL